MNTEITVGPMDILHIIEGRARHISLYAANPQQNFSPEELLKAIASLYGYADQLKGLMEEIKAKQPAQAEAPN